MTTVGFVHCLPRHQEVDAAIDQSLHNASIILGPQAAKNTKVVVPGGGLISSVQLRLNNKGATIPRRHPE